MASRICPQPVFFAIVMDKLTEEITQESPCTIMFAGNIVICGESRQQVGANLERWRYAFERREVNVSRRKAEHMRVIENGTVAQCGCKEHSRSRWTSPSIWGQLCKVIETVGVVVERGCRQGGVRGEKWQEGMIFDRRVPAEMKGKLDKTVVSPAMLYGLETAMLTRKQEIELEVGS